MALDQPPEPAFRQGEALLLTTIENGFPAKRSVEFVNISGAHQAIVRFGPDRLTVDLDALSRVQRPEPPPTIGKWFTVPTPPPIPSELELNERLYAARSALSVEHERVKAVQGRLDQAQRIADRAASEHRAANAALLAHDRSMKAAQDALERALATGAPIPLPKANGHDPRSYLTDRVSMTKAAWDRFAGDVSTQMAAMNQALEAVRSAALAIVSLLVQREIESLRQLEATAAQSRAELVAVCNTWLGGAGVGAIRLPPVSSSYLEVQPNWQEQPAVRSMGNQARIAPWQALYDKLVNGDVAADFSLGE